MLRIIVTVAFTLAVVTAVSAAAKKDDLSQYNPKILMVRGGCGFGQVMGEDGKCQSRAGIRQERRQQRRCVRHSGGAACEQDKL